MKLAMNESSALVTMLLNFQDIQYSRNSFNKRNKSSLSTTRAIFFTFCTAEHNRHCSKILPLPLSLA
jgi:hypothetical protein